MHILQDDETELVYSVAPDQPQYLYIIINL